MHAKRRGERSVLGDLRQAGSLKVLFPRMAGNDLQAVTVNTAGGVTGGDRMRLNADVADGARLCLTTQAAERAYAAQSDQVGHVSAMVTVGEGACLHWLPQEMILFDACRLRRRLDVTLAAGAQLLLCETLVFGRAAMGEVVTSGMLDDRIAVHRGGAPLVLDAIQLEGDMSGVLSRAGVAGGGGAVSTMIYVAPDAEARLEQLRSALGPQGGVSALAEDVLLMRLVAADSFTARQTLMPILTELSAEALPRPWMI